MKQTIRLNSFETNSSSTHSMIIIPDEDYKAFENGETYYIDRWNKELSTELGKNFAIFDEIKSTDWWMKNYKFADEKSAYCDREGLDPDEDIIDAENYYLDEFLRDNDIIKLENWYENLEKDENVYTTKSGDVIHIMCAYGYDY